MPEIVMIMQIIEFLLFGFREWKFNRWNGNFTP